MPKRIRDLPALTPATGDHVAIDRPGGSTGRANIAAEPAPNTLVLRNAQGAVRDGATFGAVRVLGVGGVYTWSGTNKWVPLARWTGFSGTNRGLIADLRLIRVADRNNWARLRARAMTSTSGAIEEYNISLSKDGAVTSLLNAVLVQTGNDTYELWGYFSYGSLYADGVVGTNAGSVELSPYGNLDSIAQDNPPSAISNGLYLEWATATTNQVFPGPGHIVEAARSGTSGYIRYDNGIQIVWGTPNIGSGAWTFPAAFASPPRVVATAEAASARLVTITSVSATGAGLLRTDLSGNAVAGPVHLWAIGLWK